MQSPALVVAGRSGLGADQSGNTTHRSTCPRPHGHHVVASTARVRHGSRPPAGCLAWREAGASSGDFNGVLGLWLSLQ